MPTDLKNMSNSDLCYLIEYTDKKEEAWQQLLKQSPSNIDLCYLIEYTDKKEEAWQQLLDQLGITEKVDEDALIKDIARKVLADPSCLKMSEWHCGTSHCLAGWAATINPVAKKIEELAGTETAGCAVLPHYAHLFYKDNDEVLEVLKGVVNG